jgi:hypothetical protein
MQLGRHREVVAVVLAGIESPQEVDRFLPAASFLAKRLRAADGKVTNRAGARSPAELSQRGPELGINRDLNA